MNEKIESLGGETKWEGRQFSVHVERFRHGDGSEVEREIIRRQGAVAVVVHDDEHVWLVRQPREAIGRWSLELPAGKLDVPGEEPVECAKRELAEECGLAAAQWERVAGFHASSGYTDEYVHVFAATGLSAASAEGDEDLIAIVKHPLSDLQGAIEASEDAKTVIGLQWLQSRLRTPPCSE